MTLQGNGKLDYLVEGVRRFKTVVFPEKQQLYEQLAEKQVPKALFITCGDSRIDPSAMTGTEPGQIFVERTPGNIVPVYNDTASVGVSASIEYAVFALGARDVIVCGHSACGAMKGLLHPEKLKKIPATARWLKYAEPAIESLNQRYTGLPDHERLSWLGKLNVIEQMAHLHTHPMVEAQVMRKNLTIHGWYYEIHTGRIEAYNPLTGSFEDWPPPDH
jgi:carbonic anhydrase